jgi:hypothetical protein
MPPSSISGINRLPDREKRRIYARVIPLALIKQFNLPPDFIDIDGNDLLRLNGPSGSSSTEMELRHQADFPDPIWFGHITDTVAGQLHILLYILNDPASDRFEVDRLPDGTPTRFGTEKRNINAEISAMQAGLAPGQVRRGLRMLGHAIQTFEEFVQSLGQDFYFAEPLYYHNAILFERYGFAYERGKVRMQRIQNGFTSGGELYQKLDYSTPFRDQAAANSIRLRSWAIHDGILGEPFTNVTMYKRIGHPAGLQSCPDCSW